MMKTLVLLACIFLGACGSIPRIPVEGEFFGEPVKATVDSEIARYYLENYLAENNDNTEMAKKISA
ncbi:MAG: hypothetical protein N0E58_18640, partial [Candidatus Thiodiazotropha endolucinida]|nr:hypothetical protein [Candidatus Thiodiazotropha taylori]MCW4238269.1 hypothetical protein [Candidatus Thiodiazotropha endolucinida]